MAVLFDHFKRNGCDEAFNLLPALTLNYPVFPDSCLRRQLPLSKDVGDVVERLPVGALFAVAAYSKIGVREIRARVVERQLEALREQKS